MNARREAASRPFSASSSSSTSGRRTSARASSTRRRWPYDNVRNPRDARPARPTDLSASSTRGLAAVSSAAAAECRFRRVRWPRPRKRAGSIRSARSGPGARDPGRRCARAQAPVARVVSRPSVYSRRSRPVGVGHTSPRSNFSSTVLPAPLGPVSSQRSPARTSNVTSRTAQ